MNIVESNMKYMLEAEVVHAKKARKAYQVLNTSTMQDYKAAIRMNLIKDNKVTTKDINSTEKAFGHYVGGLKCKIHVVK